MRAQIFGLMFLATAVTAASAQPASHRPPPMKTFASSSDVLALIAKAKSDLKPGQAFDSETILSLAPLDIDLSYRPNGGPPGIHPNEDEFLYVVDGSGTIVTGGTISGGVIVGGTSKAIAKGDFLLVPENTPHQFFPANGPLVFMTTKIARSIPVASENNPATAPFGAAPAP